MEMTKNGLRYDVYPDQAVVLGFSKNTQLGGTLKIPHSVYGKPVTKILARGFTNINTSTIIIPDSIIEIESEAFSGCRNLEELFVPASVQVIGYMAFAKVANVRFAIEESDIPETWDETLGYTNASFGATREG